MPLKKIKKVCECTSCGNEAEMVITCSLEPEESPPPEAPRPAPASAGKRSVKGHGVCSHCGNEAEMWIDMEQE